MFTDFTFIVVLIQIHLWCCLISWSWYLHFHLNTFLVITLSLASYVPFVPASNVFTQLCVIMVGTFTAHFVTFVSVYLEYKYAVCCLYQSLYRSEFVRQAIVNAKIITVYFCNTKLHTTSRHLRSKSAILFE